jgi:hypothetical protein
MYKNQHIFFYPQTQNSRLLLEAAAFPADIVLILGHPTKSWFPGKKV